MARPISEFSRSLLNLLSRQPLTSSGMAERLQVPLRQVIEACKRLKLSGKVVVVATLKQPGTRRPVYKYALNKELLM